MGIGTFGSFTQARSAIYAAQAGITVTGNNISNINTTGYTRQRLDQGSLYSAGSDRYYARGDVRIGQGVLVRSVSQIRSPYLDIRYRTESADMGFNDTMLDGLKRIASILDEVGKGDADKQEDGFGVLGLEFSKIHDALAQLTDQTGHQEYDSSVKGACQSFARLLNRYAASLQEAYDDTVTELHQDVDEINGLLNSIRNYNEEIRKCDIHGDNALELRDERNVAIDELSKMVGIRVHYSMEEFSPGVEIEKLSIFLDNANPDGSVDTDSSLLVDGIYSAQLILEQVPQPREVDPENPETWPYQDADGNPVMTAEEAATMETPNPAANRDEENSDTNPWYLDKNGKPTADKAASPLIPVPNEKGVLYLKADGTPTADPDEALQVDSPNFNITVSELRNEAGRLLYTNSTAPEVVIAAGDTAEIAKAAAAIKQGGSVTETKPTAYDGIEDVVVTTYREVLKPNYPYMTLRNTDGTPGGNPTYENTGIPNPSYYEFVKEETLEDGSKRKVYSSTQLPGMEPNGEYKGRYLDATGQPCKAENAARTYYKTVVTRAASTPVMLDDNDLSGQIQAHRELLTEAGEFTDQSVITNESDMSEGAYRNNDEKAGTKRGIPYFQRRLDLLANQFAKVLNESNQGYRTDPEGNYITYGTNDAGEEVGVPVTITGTDRTGNPTADTLTLGKNTSLKDQPPEIVRTLQDATGIIYKPDEDNSKELIDAYLAQDKKDADGNVIKDKDGNPVSNGIFDGGVLFSNNGSGNDTTGITAANISISYQWQHTEHLLVRSFICPPGDTEPASGDPDNIRHLMYLVDGDKGDPTAGETLEFIPSSLDKTGVTTNASSDIMFSGTFYQYWNNINTVLGKEEEMTETNLTTAYKNVLEIDTSRDAVSAVDFNDEAMNLMMYAKSYNAACRLMTTIDSVLDKLVNNTGLTT